MAGATYEPPHVELQELIAAVTAAGGNGRHNYHVPVIGLPPTDYVLARA